MLRKYLSLFLALLFLVTSCVSCSDPNVNPNVDSNLDPNVTDNGETTTAPITDVAVPYAVLIANGQTDYRIIYDDELSQTVLMEIYGVEAAIDIKYDVNISSFSDSVKSRTEEGVKEILVGHTNRPESQQAIDSLNSESERDYLITYYPESGAIAIVATDDELLAEAVRDFYDFYGDVGTKTLQVPVDLALHCMKAYVFWSLSVNGVDVSEYTVVVPDDCDELTFYAGVNLVDYIYCCYGVEIELVEDYVEETEYEFLIGDTNREESDVSVTPNGNQYLLMQDGTKIVMQGAGIYVGAAVGGFVGYLDGEGMGRTLDVTTIPTTETLVEHTFAQQHTSAILMIGDGMGFNHVAATLASGKISEFYAEQLPVQGKTVTRSISEMTGKASYTDSAAAGTALATGHKTINGYIGKDQNGKDVQNVRELAHQFGAKTAVISTDVITGATPSAFLAHNISRNNTEQLSAAITALVNAGGIDYCAGDVGYGLTTHTREALRTIASGNSTFFLMVEEGIIDKRSHSQDLEGATDMVARFNECIAYVIGFVMCHPETALIITADHETGNLRQKANAQYGYAYGHGSHTNKEVPLYALGAGVEQFNGKNTDNNEYPIFIAQAFGGDENFGTHYN